jgi:hypothetical protein
MINWMEMDEFMDGGLKRRHQYWHSGRNKLAAAISRRLIYLSSHVKNVESD